MKIVKIVGMSALLLFLGMAAPSYAQDHPQESPAKPEEKPAKPEEKPKPQDSKTPPHDSARPQKEQPKEHPDNKDARPKDEHAKVDQGRADHNPHGGGRIPDEKFRASFGREHTFHVGHPEIVAGRPHFAYGGFSFVISEPWPAGWGYDDDVYIVDIDGAYYLLDLAHPGVQVALVIA